MANETIDLVLWDRSEDTIRVRIAGVLREAEYGRPGDLDALEELRDHLIDITDGDSSVAPVAADDPPRGSLPLLPWPAMTPAEQAAALDLVRIEEGDLPRARGGGTRRLVAAGPGGCPAPPPRHSPGRGPDHGSQTHALPALPPLQRWPGVPSSRPVRAVLLYPRRPRAVPVDQQVRPQGGAGPRRLQRAGKYAGRAHRRSPRLG